MADETVVNGVGEQTAEMSWGVDVLEQEKRKLASENEETREKIKKMTIEIEKMKIAEEESKAKLSDMAAEIERLTDAEKVTAAIAARAAALETEAERLQHDLIQAMSAADEANSELNGIGQALAEKGARIEALEREAEELKAARAESEKRAKDLERKVGVLEAREVEEKNKKVRAEEQARETIAEKEKEIGLYKKTVDQLGSAKSSLESAAREAEERARVLESELVQLQKEIKERALEGVNGATNAVKEIFEEDGEDLNSQWLAVAVAGGAGAIVVGVAMLCVVYGRRR